MSLYGGIETGGTTWKCAIGTGPDDLRAEASFPTTAPAETIDRAAVFFESSEPVAALGIGSFGPVDLRAGSPTWGHVTTTPKPGWANADVAGALGRRLGVPVAFDTDVNAAALGEHRWGAAQGLDTFVYLTVGTGIGGGVMAGRPARPRARPPRVRPPARPARPGHRPVPGVLPLPRRLLGRPRRRARDRGALGQAGRAATRRRRGLGAGGALRRPRPGLRDRDPLAAAGRARRRRRRSAPAAPARPPRRRGTGRRLRAGA